MAHLKNLEHNGSKSLQLGRDIDIDSEIITLPDDIEDNEEKTEEQLEDEQILYLATNSECWIGQVDDD